ncbi:Sec1-like protein [Kockovaella imperatae]|uniref:Sec1-like protein n=1 Tax=Kockovaella imperatae TaxID=4999 RepID=A0A1Y1UK62_9TREE|nr:Sec1-like protein [Kockovaella imperatae]ORX37894.1 Sec1-like protein [Kockovaella imperatae]
MSSPVVRTSTPGAGPSKAPTYSNAPPAPSTSGDSESTAPRPVEKGLETGIFRELMRTTLVETLNEIPGAKTLILDPDVAGPLGLVTDIALLKHQAVDKIFWFEAGPLNVATRNVVWLCRPKIKHIRIIAGMRDYQYTADGLVFTLLLVPRVTELCRKVLEDEGVAGDVNVLPFKMEFIPLEDDLLSLEMSDTARDVYLNGDDTPLYYSSLALMTFQRAFGLFPKIYGKGDAAKRLTNLLERHHSSGDSLYADLEVSDQVDGLIIVDRSVDWVTPMCTQLTYEGMLDEYVGIKNAHIEVDTGLLDGQAAENQAAGSMKKRKHHLNGSKDTLLVDLRDQNFAVIGSRLSKIARRLEGDYGGAKNLKSVSEMKSFVGKLGGLHSEQQSLRLHTGLTEMIMPITRTDEFNRVLEAQQNLLAGYDPTAQMTIIEDLMYQESAWATVLRLAILMSLTSGGIKPKPLEAFKRDFLQVYGYHHLPLLINLQNLGLLVKSPPATSLPFANLRKPLRLVVDDVDDGAPNDISYVYSGYAPLSIRLVQCIAQKNAVASPANVDIAAELDGRGKKELPKAHPLLGWKGFEDVLGAIPGATVDVRQRAPGVSGRAEVRFEQDQNQIVTTVVFFLGGCTYTEIAALRWMAKQTRGRRFLIATTGIINGTNLLESLGEEKPVELTR